MQMNEITDNRLLEEFTREMEQLTQQNMSISLTLTPAQAMALIGAVQLAFRHPGYSGLSRGVVQRIIFDVQKTFSQYGVPYVLEVIRRGWFSQYDSSGEGDDHV
jgi:hypothetical protein